MAARKFTFICGADDFLVGRLGKERFAALAAEVTDEFAREVINGFAANVGEVENAVNRFRDSVQTVSMFGGRRVVWLKDVNFLADTVTGRAESTLVLVEELQRLLEGLNPDETAVLITAAAGDRRISPSSAATPTTRARRSPAWRWPRPRRWGPVSRPARLS
jgi:DNA polymerase-3 subunit delta